MAKRYFINNIDTLISEALLKELTKNDEEGGEFIHMGTYYEQSRIDKPKGVRKILKRWKPKLSRKLMLEEIDVYVYDLHFCDLKDVEYGASIFNNFELQEPKVFVLISDVMCWQNTPKKVKTDKDKKKGGEEGDGEGGGENQDENQQDNEEKQEQEQKKNTENNEEQQEGQEEGQEVNEGDQGVADQNQSQQQEEQVQVEYVAFDEKDFQTRVPLDNEKYQRWKQIEDLVLSLQRENLKVIVVAAGILYGYGEVTFKNHFKSAWLQDPKELPYLGDGENKIPTIHIQDLVNFIKKVAENPPEQNYLFGIDNSKDRRQKTIVEAISKGVGSGLVVSVEKTDLIDKNLEDVFTLDLDIKPSELLVGTEEAPADFEWYCEKGLCLNTQRVLSEFWKKHNLRPIKILMNTLSDERSLKTSKFQWATQQISDHYRIPIINVRSMIQESVDKIQDEVLKQDLKEELEKIENYFKDGKQRNIDETMKVLYRVIKWRLSQNDCLNRGYILDSFPSFSEEAQWIFFPQKPSKLKRIRPKKKKLLKKKKENEDQQQDGGQKQQEEQQADQQKKQDEEEGGDGEEQQEENEDAQNQDKAEQDNDQPKQEKQEEVEEVEEVEEEKPEGEGEGEGEAEVENEDEESKPKLEVFFPESFIFIKKIADLHDKKKSEQFIKKDKLTEKELELQKITKIYDFFAERNNEIQVFDTDNKDNFEIFENLRIYLERQGRPYNYLQSEKELKTFHDEFYTQRDIRNQEEKLKKKQKKQEEEIEVKTSREKICSDQINYVLQNEDEIDIIQKLPFRNYLLQYVVPELNDGLVEVANFLPDDPVDFLAEYLFKKSFEFGTN